MGWWSGVGRQREKKWTWSLGSVYIPHWRKNSTAREKHEWSLRVQFYKPLAHTYPSIQFQDCSGNSVDRSPPRLLEPRLYSIRCCNRTRPALSHTGPVDRSEERRVG